MADLQELQRFADEHGFGLTAPLSHQQVVDFAEAWLPEMRFHWKERFFPVRLDDIFSMVEDEFATLNPVEQNTFRVAKLVREGTVGVARSFVPPVVHVPDGFVVVPGGQTTQAVPVVRILNDGTPARDALGLREVGGDAVVTHGASFERSGKFFGPTTTVLGNGNSSEGDPFLPRASEPDPDPANPTGVRPRVTVMAQLLNLFELFKQELTVAEENAKDDYDYPPDGLRGAFFPEVLRKESTQSVSLSAAEQRAFLFKLIAAHENGEQDPEPPFGWRVDRLTWNAVKRFAFLEYTFFYAYNDFDRYQTAIFENEHEGDDEGCCLVFDRNALSVGATSSDPTSLFKVAPIAAITSVHEEFQDADVLKFVDPPLLDPSNPGQPAREAIDFTVFIAGGSHATYLTGGIHDLVDFQDYWSWVDENAPALIVLAPLLILPITIILAIIEHFVDTEDFTSEEGLHGGPGGPDPGDPSRVSSTVQVMPMSADNHIYMAANEALLRLRAYAGKWGGHDGVADKSPPFTPKTGRYFRKLLDKM